MSRRSMADAVRAVLVKRAFVPGDPGAGGMPPGGDLSAAGMPPPGGAPAAAGMPPGVDPTMGGDPMAGMLPPGVDPSMLGGAPQTGMINMTADEFTKFVKQMMAAFGSAGAPAQAQQAQPQADIGAKLDTLIAVLQGQAAKPGASAAPAAPVTPAIIAGA